MRIISQFFKKWVQGGMLTILTFLLACTLFVGFAPSELAVVYAQDETIYLDGKKGKDDNDGSSVETAVKTFEKAKELATENQNITTIYVVEAVPVSGDLTLADTNAILKRFPGYGGYLLTIAKDEEVTLRNITIDGGGENNKLTEYSLIYVDGNLNIEDGTILENNMVEDLNYIDANGGAIYASLNPVEKTINMTGGTIRNNSAYFGGGIYLGNRVTFNMSGGVIENNKVNAGRTYNDISFECGGGIAAFKGCTINLSDDALITGNSSAEIGGGISLGTIVDISPGNTLNMTGGTISDNKAGSSGGGIYVQAGTGNGYSVANISAGKIINNSMTGEGLGNKMFGGGGIYVNGENPNYGRRRGILNLSNALVTDNEALIAGGGYASCPVSDTDVNVKNGIAIYGNRARRAEDIDIESGYIYGKEHSGSPSYSISAFMLGGTPYNWKNDANEELPINKLNGTLKGYEEEILGLHTDVKEDAEAESLAKVIISGNYSATRGGGIGSNGAVNTGEKKVIKIKVSKIWKYDNPETRPETITIELYRINDEDPANPIYIGAETVSEEAGKWDMIFTNIPKLDNDDRPYRYMVKEKALEGYSSKVSGNQTSGFEIVNIPGISLSVEKKWIGESTNQVEIKLLADGATKAKFTLTEAEGWKHSFENLPKFDANDGHEIVYTVEESAISGYISAISGDATNGYIVTNTKTTTPPEPENPNSPENPNPNPPGNTTPSNPPTPSRPSRPSTPTPSTPGSSTPPTSTPPTPTVAGESRPTPTPDSSEVIDAVATPDPEHIPQVLGESREVAGNKRDTPTGDSSHLLLWAGFFSLSALGLSYYGLRKSKKI